MSKFSTIIKRVERDKGFIKIVSFTAFTKGVTAIGSIVFSFVVARTLGAEELGKFMLIMSVAIGLSVFSTFGIGNALIRYSAILFKEETRSKYLSVLIQAFSLPFLISLLIIFLLIGITACFGDDFEFLHSSYHKAMYSVPLLCFFGVITALLKGVGKPQLSAIFENGSLLLIASGLLWVQWVSGYKDSSGVLLRAYTGSLIILGIIMLLFLRIYGFSFYRKGTDFKFNVQFFRDLPDYAISSFIVYIMQWGGLIIIAAFLTSKDVGVYSTAHRLAFSVNFILVVFNSVTASGFSKFFHEKRLDELELLAQKSTWYMIIVAGLAALILILLSGFIARKFGSDFVDLPILLLILVPGQFINAATGSVGFMLNMTGHQKYQRIIMTISALLYVALLVILLPIIGIWGAAIATSVMLVIQNITAFYWVKKKIGINMIGLKFLRSDL